MKFWQSLGKLCGMPICGRPATLAQEFEETLMILPACSAGVCVPGLLVTTLDGLHSPSLVSHSWNRLSCLKWCNVGPKLF